MRYVMDASAVLAVFFREPGAANLYDLMSGAAIGAVNISEVVAKLQERGISNAEIDQSIEELGLQVVPFDFDQAIHAGKLRAVTRSAGLSLGDRACLALAAAEGATAITMDRHWATLDLSVPIRVVRD